MLVGLSNNTVITGAFGAGEGACPMLAAHREGGRTSVCSFPQAWDTFCGVAGRHIVRPATEYEVQILRREIEASLAPQPSILAEAISDHQATVEAQRQRAQLAEQQRLMEQQLEEEEAAAEPRKRRLRITGGEYIDFTEVIQEHMASARQRRSREAEATGLGWLFEETLVLPEDFGQEDEQAFDFDAAESDLLRS